MFINGFGVLTGIRHRHPEPPSLRSATVDSAARPFRARYPLLLPRGLGILAIAAGNQGHPFAGRCPAQVGVLGCQR